MNPPLLPQNVTRIGGEETFRFSCHPAISCFTECCRQLELALTPYDILRLKKACGLGSDEFLHRYVIMEQEEHETFPRLYLTMVDDGRESCVFVSPAGCTVYEDRPGACRAYPVGRAAIRQPESGMGKRDGIEEFFVLIQEGHCRGFQEQQVQNATSYAQGQGLSPYNRFNDAVAAILQHEQVRRQKRFSEDRIEQFILALYNLDQFRTMLFAGDLPGTPPLDETTKDRLRDDEELLLHAIDWLRKTLFTD
jgi:uncharacterized protein